MTRNAFITQLEKRLADLFPSWEAKEQELTMDDVHNILMPIEILCIDTETAIRRAAEDGVKA